VDRVGRASEYIENARLTLGLAVQSEVLRSLSETSAFRGQGLLARFLYSIPNDLVGTRLYQNRPISQPAQNVYEQAIRSILALGANSFGEEPKIHALTIAGESLDKWQIKANEIELRQAPGCDLSGIRDWASKLAGAAARITGGMHLVKYAARSKPWEIPIEAETIENAWRIGDYLLEHALCAFNEMGVSADVALAKRILDWITANKLDAFTFRDCQRSNRQSKSEIDEALSILVDRGFVRELPEKGSRTAGRPKRDYIVYPYINEFASNN
jgi:hypothetical protein